MGIAVISLRSVGHPAQPVQPGWQKRSDGARHRYARAADKSLLQVSTMCRQNVRQRFWVEHEYRMRSLLRGLPSPVWKNRPACNVPSHHFFEGVVSTHRDLPPLRNSVPLLGLRGKLFRAFQKRWALATSANIRASGPPNHCGTPANPWYPLHWHGYFPNQVPYQLSCFFPAGSALGEDAPAKLRANRASCRDAPSTTAGSDWRYCELFCALSSATPILDSSSSVWRRCGFVRRGGDWHCANVHWPITHGI